MPGTDLRSGVMQVHVDGIGLYAQNAGDLGGAAARLCRVTVVPLHRDDWRSGKIIASANGIRIFPGPAPEPLFPA